MQSSGNDYPLQIIRPKDGATDRFMQNIGWCIEQFKF